MLHHLSVMVMCVCACARASVEAKGVRPSGAGGGYEPHNVGAGSQILGCGRTVLLSHFSNSLLDSCRSLQTVSQAKARSCPQESRVTWGFQAKVGNLVLGGRASLRAAGREDVGDGRTYL